MKRFLLVVSFLAFVALPVSARGGSIDFEGSAIGTGESIKISAGKYGLGMRHVVYWKIIPMGVMKVSAATIMIQGAPKDDSVPSGLVTPVAGDGAIISPALVVGSTAEKIAHGLFYYRIGGVNKYKVADAVGVVFSAAHKVAANKFGAIGVYVDAIGTISTKIDSAAQTDTMSHDTAAIALIEVQVSDFPYPTDTIQIGYILIANNGTLWTANTDDLTNGSDITTATFFNTTSPFSEIEEYELSSGDIAIQKGTFYLAPTFPDKFYRLFLSAITGEGTFIITDNIFHGN